MQTVETHPPECSNDEHTHPTGFFNGESSRSFKPSSGVHHVLKSVFITGCSSGIGRCLALGLKVRGYRVFASVRNHADIAALETAGVEVVLLDLVSSQSVQTAASTVLQRTDGNLYALINNGAYGQPGAVEDLSRDVLRLQLETNLLGWHELTCQVIPTMRRQGFGRIIQISSVLGLVTLSYRGAYVASKFALEGLTDTLRLELAGTGIHVSLVEPGPIISRFRANAYQAFRQHIDVEHSPHRDRYQAMEARLQKTETVSSLTLPPEAVLRRVVQALECRRPKPRYYVTSATYLLGILRRILPTHQLDMVLQLIAAGEQR